MQKPLMIILLGLIGGIIIAIGFYLASYLGFTPFGKAFNNFFTMVGVILSLISGFFLISFETLRK